MLPSPYPKQHLSQLSHFCTAHNRDLYFTIGHPFPSQNAPSCRGSAPNHGCWTHPNSQPKWHFDQFSRFSRADDHDRQTGRQSDHATPPVTVCHIYICTVMRSNNYVDELKHRMDTCHLWWPVICSCWHVVWSASACHLGLRSVSLQSMSQDPSLLTVLRMAVNTHSVAVAFFDSHSVIALRWICCICFLPGGCWY